MASENDQEFNDDVVLQLALQMSMQQPTSPIATTAPMVTEAPDMSPVEEASASPAASEPLPVKPAATVQADSPKKKKKKKNAYASMMAGVMAPTLTDEEKKRENDEKIKRSMGGGQFSKLDKI